MEQVKHLTLAFGECLHSYDISVFFTSAQVDPALRVIKDLLEKDPAPKDRTVLLVKDITLIVRILSKKCILFIPRPVL